ncbi:hypothetical protein SDC9_146938 [bioreactor metagenome]|uniref:Uncharacterized protein n=1 Tax=bioreactor metagenome TaxID=1076179 RepID=A0A645ECH8_9ZZZZ
MILVFAVRLEVFEVRLDRVGARRGDPLHHQPLVIGGGFAFDQLDRTARTLAQAGAESVAEEVADQAGFAVDHLDRAFGAVRNAVAAAVAERLVDFDDFSFHNACSPLD